MTLPQLAPYAAAGTTLAVLFGLAVAKVVNDTVEDGGDERPNGDSFPAPFFDSSFHAERTKP